MTKKKQLVSVGAAIGLVAVSTLASATEDQTHAAKPNILVIWGDDIGPHNISAYNNGIMGYETPSIDRIANEGAMFTHFYAQQSCTAGRASFILGQHPFRTGLLTIGMPGSTQGIPDWAPTLADLLKNYGYATIQVGKNHLGDNNVHLPTVHGFDEFFGNLYHLNAEEEPETYAYPKDPAFRKKYGPRGVLKTRATERDDPTVMPRWGKVGKQTIEDTGSMTRKRMETADEEFLRTGLNFIDRAHEAGKPFFAWVNTTRMHIWTRLKEESRGVTGTGLYPDGMVEHDGHVGILLDKLDELGIADNTIVIYSTDNGTETVSWPDGGITPFHGEKGTTWEGGMRVPCVIRWPGVIEPGRKYSNLMSQEDWLPTLLASVGEPEIVEKLKQGYTANGKEWRVHLDGHNFLPFFKGEVEESPRDQIMYFGQGGELNAVRWMDWKVHFASIEGNIATGQRIVTNWPLIVNLKADPYEKALSEADMGYLRWYADNMWLFVPVQEQIAEFLGTLSDYPFQEGMSLSAAGINYNSLKAMRALKMLDEINEHGVIQLPSK